MRLNLTVEDAVIFDIDGTLSDHSHRIKYLIEKHDHKLYYSLCTEDPVFQDVLDILNTYKIKIIMLTGRPERLRTRTSCWLAFNHIKSDLLIMRPDYNYEKDFIVKERELLKLEKKYNIVCAYDDREQNIEMFKRHNIKAVKVHNELLKELHNENI